MRSVDGVRRKEKGAREGCLGKLTEDMGDKEENNSM